MWEIFFQLESSSVNFASLYLFIFVRILEIDKTNTRRLEEFKKLNPPVDLVEGAVIEMTIRGDTLLYKNAVGGVGSLKSRLFLEALCDVFYGKDPVSPTHKESVLKGIPKL